MLQTETLQQGSDTITVREPSVDDILAAQAAGTGDFTRQLFMRCVQFNGAPCTDLALVPGRVYTAAMPVVMRLSGMEQAEGNAP